MATKKKWGQHFLRSRRAVDTIASAVDASPSELVVEIGPGEGVLTDRLAALYPGRLIAIEIDPDLAARLRSRFGEHVDIVNDDALLASLPVQPYCAAGNLPYNVATPILTRILHDPNARRCVFMLQKEVADRLLAKPGDAAYGYLTVHTALFASVEHILTLEPRAFFPPPKVRSAVVVLHRRDPTIKSGRDDLLALISTAFRMRRKTLLNNLKGFRGLSRAEAEHVLHTAGVPDDVRAEQLDVRAFDQIRRAIDNLPMVTATDPVRNLRCPE